MADENSYKPLQKQAIDRALNSPFAQESKEALEKAFKADIKAIKEFGKKQRLSKEEIRELIETAESKHEDELKSFEKNWIQNNKDLIEEIRREQFSKQPVTAYFEAMSEEAKNSEQMIQNLSKEKERVLSEVANARGQRRKVLQRQADEIQKSIDQTQQYYDNAQKALENIGASYEELSGRSLSSIDKIRVRKLQATQRRETASTVYNQYAQEFKQASEKLDQAKVSGNQTEIDEAAEALKQAAQKLEKSKEEKRAVEKEETKASMQASAAETTEKLKEEYGAVDSVKDGINQGLENASAKVSESVYKASENLEKVLDKAVDDAMDVYTEYTARINARLQGSEKSFTKAADMITQNLMFSNITTQKEVLKKLDGLTQKGIVYNVEQRAFLSAITDKVVNSFDVANETLLRLIRVQQSDSTIARLGIEASLTKFLNSRFKDTSYLSGLRQTVSDAIFEANSLLSREASSEFEFTVQKWLGSLYSVGASQNLITMLAKGIGTLGSGGIESLTSDEPLLRLFAMASQRSTGKDLGSLLTDGLDASEANDLLKATVEFLQEIADNTSESNVVKSVYSQIFGSSVSDIQAITNLNQEQINSIYQQQATYNQLQQEVSNQISDLVNPFSGRMTIAEQMKNILGNLTFSAGAGIAENPVMYLMYKGISAIEGATGGTPLPDINVMGSGISLHTTFEQIAKTGLVGFAMLGKFLGGISHLGDTYSGNLLDMWGAEDVISRGTGLNLLAQSGFSSGTSESTYVGTTATEDIKKGSLASATEDASSVKDVTQQEFAELKNIDDLYKAIIENDEKLKIVDVNIKSWDSELTDNPIPTNTRRIEDVPSKQALLDVINDQDNVLTALLNQLIDPESESELRKFIAAYLAWYNSGRIPIEDTSYFATAFNNPAGNFMNTYQI